MSDRTLAIRRAILPALKVSGPVVVLVPPASIYPARTAAVPPFPFIRYGATTTTPFRASGLDSSAVAVAIHAFAKPLYVGGAMVETAEDQAHRMAAAIVGALDSVTLALEGEGNARVTWIGSNVLQDGDEADAWHTVVRFQIEAAG